MTIARIPLFAGYRQAFAERDRDGTLVPAKVKQTQVDGLEQLLTMIERDPTMVDLRHVAYLLATVKHECANTWQPITEYGNVPYFRKYEPGTSIGKALGNTHVGDGYLYRGRGYVQITGRRNYAKFGIENDPEAALEHATAYRIASEGMRLGRFTGKKLSDYITATSFDYRNARRIINGLDDATLIAGYATRFEKILRAAIIAAPNPS